MNIPYRARRNLRHFLVGTGVLLLFAALLLILWLLWLNRYVVYTRDGAKLDFSLSPYYATGITPTAPEPAETIVIFDKAEEEEASLPKELVRFSGYAVSLESLKDDLAAVETQLLALPKGTTIALELKDVRGYAYYTSTVAAMNPDFDTTAVDALVRKLIDSGYYVIAQIPAFQEYEFIMENQRDRVKYGLPQVGSGSSLWLDKEFRCYWLNPASDGTLTYLIQLITELRSIGFHEVLFSDFRFPRTEKIVFSGDQAEALAATAATLVKTCATDSFCVSFTRNAADLPLPQGRTRLYLTDIAAGDISAAAENSGLGDPLAQLVFITDLSDTRYDEYCALRPLETAH